LQAGNYFKQVNQQRPNHVTSPPKSQPSVFALHLDSVLSKLSTAKRFKVDGKIMAIAYEALDADDSDVRLSIVII
jgi:hypothetical protein